MNQREDDSIEGEFVRSWDDTEQLLSAILKPGAWKDQMLQFIAQLRQAGYDRQLRAGQSLFAFVLSRSRHHGLRPDQPSVAFHLHDGVMDMHERKNVRDDTYIRNTESTLSDVVQAALARLLTHPID